MSPAKPVPDLDIISLPEDDADPETATLFVPGNYVEPKPCCPDFPKRPPLLRTFVIYGCFLLFGCGCQLTVLCVSEHKQFINSFGKGFNLAQGYFKAAAAATSYAAALLGGFGVRYRSMRGLFAMVIVLCINAVLAVLTEVLTRSYSVDGTIHSFLVEYMRHHHHEEDEGIGAEGILNNIQREFSCCGGKYGVKDYGKTAIPASCCYLQGHHEHLEDDHHAICNVSIHMDEVHSRPCVGVTGQYLQHVLLTSEVTIFYCVVVSLLCFFFTTMYACQVYKENNEQQLRNKFTLDAED